MRLSDETGVGAPADESGLGAGAAPPATNEQRMEGADGVVLSVRVEGSGPACLLIHGYRDASYVWTPLIAKLSPRFTTIAPDLRGHGASDWESKGSYRFESYVEDMHALLRRLAVDQVLLVGHSLGGRVAVRMAQRLGGRARGLLIVDTSPRSDSSVITAVSEPADSVFASPQDFIDRLTQTRPLLSPEMRELVAGGSLRSCEAGGYRFRSDPALVRQQRVGEPRRDELEQELSELDCPTLVLRGAWSALLKPDAAVRMAAAPSRGRLETVPRAGHAVMMDNPEGFCDAATAFLTELRSDEADASAHG